MNTTQQAIVNAHLASTCTETTPGACNCTNDYDAAAGNTNPNRPTPPNYCALCGEVPYDIECHAEQARCVSTPRPYVETIAVSDLISLLENETGIDRNDLYAMIGRAAIQMGLS